jgi:thymidylate synthase ThyX
LRADITAKVIASSIGPSGVRLDSLQLRYPRIIHAEFMTHRLFSRNASSSRAIPVASMTAREEIFVPEFSKNKPGMQAGRRFTEDEQIKAAAIWRRMADACLEGSKELAEIGAHKEHANRPLEWFGYIDVVCSSTHWSNWDALRDHPDAQPEIRDLAVAIKNARASVRPTTLKVGDWHLPYVTDEVIKDVYSLVDRGEEGHLLDDTAFAFRHNHVGDLDCYTQLLICISAARCCRVSYAKHDGTPSSLEDDIRRFCLLAQSQPIHASPLEHQAQAVDEFFDPSSLSGNFSEGWVQFRKLIPGECM